jgi:hypothetical protein
MKSTEADIRFPAVGFTPDGDMWGFDDIDALTECGPMTLRQNMQSGMEVIGSDGGRWVVRSIRRVGRNKPLLPWLLWRLLSGPGWRIEQELEEVAPVTLDDIKTRAIQFLEAHPEDHCPDGPQSKDYKRLLAQLRAARSVAKLQELLGLDWFIAY